MLKPMTIEKIRYFFRRLGALIYRVKAFYYKKRFASPVIHKIDPASVKRLILMGWHNKLGDAVVMGAFVDLINRYRPDIELTILTGDLGKAWLSGFAKAQFLDVGQPSHQNAKSLIAYQGQFDAFVDLTTNVSPRCMMALYYSKTPIIVGYDKADCPLYNVNIDSKHFQILKRYVAAAQLFITETVQPRLPHPPIHRPEPNYPDFPTLKAQFQHVVAVNLFSASRHRSFTLETGRRFLAWWCEHFPNDLLLLVPVPNPDHMATLKALEKAMRHTGQVALPKQPPSLDLTIGLIADCDFCFSPDTSIVHIASALNQPLIAIYQNNHAHYTWKEWCPHHGRYEVILTRPVTDPNVRVPVDDFSKEDFLNAYHRITADVKEHRQGAKMELVNL
tara:strand:- start:7103 stop:8272 length:1170 start_codon:yes stop_codon:yes gene_type:complete